MLLGFLRWFRGYVVFSVSGRFPERFINIALKNKLRLWSVTRSDGSLTACMYMRDYRRIRRYARGSGVRLKIIERRGVPVLMRRYSDRMGLVFGAAVFVLTVFVMSLFVWSIDVTGLEKISESEMRSMLADSGIYVGAFKPAVDTSGASRDLMLRDSRIGWMAINMNGSYASVEIKEETPSPTVEDLKAPCNVKAVRDGTILHIDAEQGKTTVKEGSGVVAGQVIVTGVLEDQRGGVRLVHSKARVIAQTLHQARFRLPKTVTLSAPTGEVNERYAASVFGLTLPLSVGGVHTVGVLSDETAESPAPLGVTLPVALKTRRLYAIEQREKVLDNNSAKELLLKEAHLYELFTLADCKVTSRDFRFLASSDGYTLSVDYTCREDIAYQEKIGVEK